MSFHFYLKAQPKLRKFLQIDKISIWQQSCNRLPAFRYLSVNYQHIYIYVEAFHSKKLIVYSRLEQSVNIPIALFQFLCSGQILVKPKQAPPLWTESKQSSPTPLIGPALTSFMRSFYATVTAVSISPWFTFLFLESSGTNLSLTCSRPSSLSASPRFALCFWKCMWA